MFNKILIANRGEIACRVIKTARKMGIQTVAVFSDSDKNALHVKMADEAVYLGASPASESYLRADKVIEAAIKTGAEAIHPGYGFLSENAEFCRICDTNNITFIGPPVEAIEKMGSKSAAKSIMEQANVPLVPGYHGEDQSEHIIKQAADDMGYPVLLKAAAGGGGKGMRQVWSEDEFSDSLAAAKREALSSFGDDVMLVEKYLTEPRHVEIQVFCDQYGNGVYLFERDCSVQRRHQKVIEEAPAFGMSESLRQQMGEAALKAAKAIDYVGAGTVEFLLDSDGSFYFMEMNTRLQVEHPVTEFITGQDLVEWQLKVAAGQALPKQQDQLTIHGHAFEARIYAEDPDNDFLPATGTITYLKTPDLRNAVSDSTVRIDTGVEQGDDISVFYDPMIAKLIVWGENRKQALLKLNQALNQYQLAGLTTNISFLQKIVGSEPFKNEQIDTGFIEKQHHELFTKAELDVPKCAAVAALGLLLNQQQNSGSNSDPWQNISGWRLNAAHVRQFDLDIDGNDIVVTIESQEDGFLINSGKKQFTASAKLTSNQLTYSLNGVTARADLAFACNSLTVFTKHNRFTCHQQTVDLGQDQQQNTIAGLQAPMNGTLVEVLVKAGEEVKAEQPVAIMEAMKMEHTIKAPSDGVIADVYFNAGDMVDGGAELVKFEPAKN